jgi:hypothetical protein
MEKLGTEKIEKLLASIKELVIVGKKVKEDGKVDVADIAHLIALLPKIPVFIEDFKAVGEVFEEGKDLDVAEVVVLIQKVHALVKQIEAA